jgi:hypothetical protein
MKWFFVLLPLITACTTLSTNLEESRLVNESAATKGFTKNPLEAAKQAARSCKPDASLKWELKLDANSPLLMQPREGSEPAYGPFALICFSFETDEPRELKISTKHTGGGYSKAYYVLPAIYLFTKKAQAVDLSREFQMQQNAWSGDYSFTLPLKPKAKEFYLLVVEANNRFPKKPWSAFANPGLGWALQGVFPVNVMSSPHGVVSVEIK